MPGTWWVHITSITEYGEDSIIIQKPWHLRPARSSKTPKRCYFSPAWSFFSHYRCRLFYSGWNVWEFWLGRSGPAVWLAGSPELAPLIPFFWQFVKSLVNWNSVSTEGILNQSIMKGTSTVHREVLSNSWNISKIDCVLLLKNWVAKCDYNQFQLDLLKLGDCLMRSRYSCFLCKGCIKKSNVICNLYLLYIYMGGTSSIISELIDFGHYIAQKTNWRGCEKKIETDHMELI